MVRRTTEKNGMPSLCGGGTAHPDSNLALWLACANGKSMALERNSARNHGVSHASHAAHAVPGGFYISANEFKPSNKT